MFWYRKSNPLQFIKGNELESNNLKVFKMNLSLDELFNCIYVSYKKPLLFTMIIVRFTIDNFLLVFAFCLFHCINNSLFFLKLK